MEEFEITPNNISSIYNDAGLQIMRLNTHWTNCSRYRKNNQLNKCYKELIEAEIELYNDIVKMKKEEALEAINKKIEDISKSATKKNFTLSARAFMEMLVKKEKFLRIVQNDIGKGGKYSEGDEDYFD